MNYSFLDKIYKVQACLRTITRWQEYFSKKIGDFQTRPKNSFCFNRLYILLCKQQQWRRQIFKFVNCHASRQMLFEILFRYKSHVLQYFSDKMKSNYFNALIEPSISAEDGKAALRSAILNPLSISRVLGMPVIL